MNETTNKPPFILSDTLYPKVKWMIIIVIPAIGTLYFALAKIWSLPAGEQILGTLIAVQAFLGAIFAVSTSQYEKSGLKYDGDINIIQAADGEKHAQFAFNEHPTNLEGRKDATFKVNSPPE